MLTQTPCHSDPLCDGGERDLTCPAVAVVALILVFTGWRGGDLVYKHRVGIPDQR